MKQLPKELLYSKKQPPADISLSSLSPLPPHAGGVFFLRLQRDLILLEYTHERINRKSTWHCIFN